MPIRTTLGEFISQLRTNAGLTLYELEKRTGIRRSTLMRIEDGSTTNPSQTTLNTLARGFGIEPELLYDAVWLDADDPLPSLAVYFRNKYALSDEQIAALTTTLERLTSGEERKNN